MKRNRETKYVTMSTGRAVEIGSAWINIVWIVCYLVFGLIPGLGPATVSYMIHMNIGSLENIFSIGNFIMGLILWNLFVTAGVALAGLLSNYIKD